MRTAAAAAVVTPAVAVPALALTPVLFPPSPHMAPAPEQVPFFAALAGINALALGLGVAFLAVGLPTMRRVLAPAGRARAVAAYLAVAWLLVSWYPHGGLHASIGMDTGALLWVEYGFHVPLVIAPLVLIWALTGTRSIEQEVGGRHRVLQPRCATPRSPATTAADRRAQAPDSMRERA